MKPIVIQSGSNDHEIASVCGFKISLKMMKLAITPSLKFWYDPFF